MTFSPDVGNGAQLMDTFQQQAALNGYSLDDAENDCEVTPGSSALTVDVGSGLAQIAGGSMDIAGESGVSLPAPDPDNPRKVLVYLDSNGAVQTEGGDPSAVMPEGEIRWRTFNPTVPIPAEAFLPLAEIWLEADASDIDGDDIRSRRVPTTNIGTTDPYLEFGIYPTEVSEGIRESIYDDFSAVAESYSAMNTIAYYPTIIDEVAASSTAMGAVAASSTGMNAVSTSNTAMDAVAASNTAMDAVAASSTAMDEVAASSTAMDAVWESDLAFDTVASVNMAIGKYSAGRAGLDPTDYADMDAVAASSTGMNAVAASSTAMDAVAASSTAMDEVATSSTGMNVVSTSTLALTAALESSYVGTIWADPEASRIWENATPGAPYDFGSNVTSSIVQNPTGVSNALEVEADNASNNGYLVHEITLDLDTIGTLTVQTQDLENDVNSDYVQQVITIDGSAIWTNASNHSWTERDLDVSGYSGEVEVGFGLEQSQDSSAMYQYHFADIGLA